MKQARNIANYYRKEILSFKLGELSIQVASKPGITFWDEITPAEQILIETIHAQPEDTFLYFGCRHGGAAVLLGSQNPWGHIWLSDLTSIALDCSRGTLDLNDIAEASVFHQPSNLSISKPGFDRAVVVLPKGRKLARRWLVEAHSMLKDGGLLYLAGSNNEGIQSVSRDAAELFGERGTVSGYKKGNRCISFLKSSTKQTPDWTQEAGILPNTWVKFPYAFGNAVIQIYSLPGVFSMDHIDDGTELLIQNLDFLPDERILDVGCGYGILGLVAYKLAPGVSRIDMVDTNLLAIACAQKNVEEIVPKKDKDVFRVKAMDLMENLESNYYSLVLTNPPFHTGKAVDYSISQVLIQEAFRVLKPGGRFILVANRFIQYDKEMEKIFQNVRTLASNSRYHILEADKEG